MSDLWVVGLPHWLKELAGVVNTLVANIDSWGPGGRVIIAVILV